MVHGVSPVWSVSWHMQTKAIRGVTSARAGTPRGGGGSGPSALRALTQSRGPWTRFAAPTLADALFLVVLLRGLQLGATGFFNDPGTGWHLRTGADILATGRVPVADTFSHVRFGAPWVETQWLGDSVMHLAFSAAGYAGLALLTAVILAALFRWVYRTHLACNGFPAVGLVVALVAAGAASGHFLARPLLASTVGIPLSFWWATEYARGRMGARKLLWLIPIAVFWTNLHPGVLGGIATVLLCGGGLFTHWLVTPRLRRGAGTPRRAATLLAVGAGMGAATLVNPYGLGYHAWIARLMDMPLLAGAVQEWMPPVWSAPDTIMATLLVVGVVVGVVVRRTGTSACEGLVILFWLTQATQSYRHLPVTALIVALQLGRVFGDVRLRRAIPLLTDDFRAAERRGNGGPASAVVVALLAVCAITGTAVPGVALAEAGPAAERYSAGAMAYLREHPPDGPIFNALRFGGQLIHEVPELRVFIDDRFGLYGEEFIQEYIATVSKPDERLGSLLDRGRFDIAVVAAVGAPANWLSASPQWTEAYRDAVAAVYRRR